jgi:thiosulfate/3-mercaptopyruvate sulfurtransferase
MNLVTARWVHDHLDDPDVRIIEAGDAEACIPGAVAIDGRELRDPVRRDVVGPDDFAELLGGRGVSDDHTIVVSGELAAHAYWCLVYYGHPDVKLLGEPLRVDGRPQPPSHPPEHFHARSPDHSIRALRNEVMAALDNGTRLVDVRSTEEYAAGHIPGAISIPAELFEGVAPIEGLDDGEPVITYGHSGEHSARAWFALRELFGLRQVKNYDGGWTEWGNLVGVPVCALHSTPARRTSLPISPRWPEARPPRSWS